MAIGTTPLFSKISGSVGPVDYRTRRNGKIEIGKKRIPANPQSTEQQNTRNAYGRLHELWQNAAWIDKTQYENIAAAYDISPWNAFLMRHLPIMRLNPAGYWPAVEGSGNTIHDFTTNELHGTISGATWKQSGKYNITHLEFDGTDDYWIASIPADTSNGFSLHCWHDWKGYTNGVASIILNIGTGHGTFDGCLDIIMDPGNKLHQRAFGVAYSSSATLPKTGIHSNCLSIDENGVGYGYYDAKLKGSSATGIENFVNNNMFVGEMHNGNYAFKSTITETCIFYRPLTTNEITVNLQKTKKFIDTLVT